MSAFKNRIDDGPDGPLDPETADEVRNLICKRFEENIGKNSVKDISFGETRFQENSWSFLIRFSIIAPDELAKDHVSKILLRLALDVDEVIHNNGYDDVNSILFPSIQE